VLFENPDSLTRIFTPSSADPNNKPGTHHGFWRYNGAPPAFGHAGHSYHFSNFAVIPEERFGFLAISNGLEDVNAAIFNFLLGSAVDFSNIDTIGFPNAASVEGHYRMAQSYFTSNFIAPLAMLAPADTVTAIDDNTIELNTLMFGTAAYRQIEPYVFQIISSDNPAMAVYFNTLRFRMADGNPVQIHVGDGKDFLISPPNPFLMLSFAGLSASIMFFLISPIVLFILFLKNRKKDVVRTRFHLLSSCFLLSGTLLALNNTIFFSRFASTFTPASAPLAPHIWINYVIAVLSVLLFAVSLIFLRRAEIRVRRKVFYGITSFFTAVLILVLNSLNFFVLL
jgi:hypothetical protein